MKPQTRMPALKCRGRVARAGHGLLRLAPLIMKPCKAPVQTIKYYTNVVWNLNDSQKLTAVAWTVLQSHRQ